MGQSLRRRSLCHPWPALSRPSRPDTAGAKKGEPAQTVTVKLAPNASVQYSWVGADGARPTVGYQALVRLASGSKDAAERVVFVGAEHLKGRPAQISARVAKVAQDG